MAGSHSTGISVSDDLRNKFGAAMTDNSVRFLRVTIEGEKSLICSDIVKSNGEWKADLDLVKKSLDDKTPCYILFRTDETSKDQGYQWFLLCYVPDKSPVRSKMLYAATRANLKLQLGAGKFVEDLFGTVPSDFSTDGYDKHVAAKNAPPPLTDAEIAKEEEEKDLSTGGAATTGGAYSHGVKFALHQSIVDGIGQLKAGKVNFVEVLIDDKSEKVTAGMVKDLDTVDDLAKLIHTAEPRYFFYNYKHQYEAQNLNSLIFIFSCPDGSHGTKSAPIKLRMLYSSSKANVLSLVNGMEVAAKFEINAPSEISDQIVMDTLHPPKVEKKLAFAKPTRAGRGGRKLIGSTH